MVFSDAVTVFVLDRHASFAVLQSQVHELWAGFQGSSFKDDPRYIPEDCFETFPFPDNWQTVPALEVAGLTYYEFRAALMIGNNEGLTKTYNRFHDPDQRDPQIVKLRELHKAMDDAVLDAYGWSDIKTDYEFVVDYEIDEENRGNQKKPCVTAGPTRPVTRCWRGSSSSMLNALRRKSAPAALQGPRR
jgi:hypothetical protein